MEAIKRKIRAEVKRLLPGHLPQFLIVGAQRSATTAFHFYLNQHPSLIGSRPKEVCYFDRDGNYEKGAEWYSHNFPNTRSLRGGHIYFEATPEYLYRSYAAERIHRFNPEMKIVILLREPVQRAFSAWSIYLTFKNRGFLPPYFYESYVKGGDTNILREFYEPAEFPSFREVVAEDIRKFNTNSTLEEPSIVRRGIYYPQVKRFLDLFGKERVLILGFMDVTGPGKVAPLNDVLKLMGMPSSDWKFLNDEPRNMKANKTDVIPPDMHELLTDFYRPHNEQLFGLIGGKPNW